jgi:serine/threonine protein kinase
LINIINNNNQINIEIIKYIQNLLNCKFIKFIASGSFAIVYLIQINNKNYAIKLVSHEYDDNDTIVIKNDNKKARDSIYCEYLMLSQHFIDNNNIAKLADIKNNYKEIKNINNYEISYLIMDFYEETLNIRYDRFNNKFDDDQIKNIGLQLINIIQYIHRFGYIYIDFKLDNIMFLNQKSNDIILIDFGICNKYVDNRNLHKPQQNLKNTVGTDNFNSILANLGKQPDRIGDIQSIGYIMLYLYNNELPWKNAKSSNQILNYKKNIFDSEIFKNSPEYIQKFITKTYGYKYSDKPDYYEFKMLLS